MMLLLALAFFIFFRSLIVPDQYLRLYLLHLRSRLIVLQSLLLHQLFPVLLRVNCWCVVLDGCITRLFESPILARWENSLTLSMNFLPASNPPSIPNPINPP